MDITFRTRKLERTFNSETKLYAEYGQETGRVIIRRMAFLQASPSLAEVPHTPPLRRHQLTGPRAGKFAVDLIHPKRLVFEPNHDPVPRKEDGGIDLGRVTIIRILSVEDYH